ncbi:hypothetical protein MC81_32150 (plasmid) [Achromobacter insolitus]|nr:hypothetical protein MC81_32150 [Achromobacter insolitus]
MTSLSNNGSSPTASQTQTLNMRPPPGRGGTFSAFRRDGNHAGSSVNRGNSMGGWMPVPAALLQMVGVWDAACSQAAAAALLHFDRLYWQERLVAFRKACHRLSARYGNGISGATSEAAQENKGWGYAPLELLDMLEDLDTACVLAAAAEQNPSKRENWDECIDMQRAARELLDSATPTHLVPLVPR